MSEDYLTEYNRRMTLGQAAGPASTPLGLQAQYHADRDRAGPTALQGGVAPRAGAGDGEIFSWHSAALRLAGGMAAMTAGVTLAEGAAQDAVQIAGFALAAVGLFFFFKGGVQLTLALGIGFAGGMARLLRAKATRRALAAAAVGCLGAFFIPVAPFAWLAPALSAAAFGLMIYRDKNSAG